MEEVIQRFERDAEDRIALGASIVRKSRAGTNGPAGNAAMNQIDQSSRQRPALR